MARFGPASLKQAMFLKADADIIVYGGSAGSGKSYLGIGRHLRYVNDPKYKGYVIRKNMTMLTKSGGLLDKAHSIFKNHEPRVIFKRRDMQFIFPSGAVVAFSNYENDAAGEIYRGLELSGAMYDEATQAKEEHIWNLVSRIRSEAKVNSGLWLTCNPDPDSYLFKWVLPYLYPEGHEFAGRPRPEMDGVVRWLLRIGDSVVWGDSAEELIEGYGHMFPKGNIPRPLSFTFISGTIYDNPPLIANNPTYLNQLQQLPRVECERLLHGNWFARQENSGYFKRGWLGTPVRDMQGLRIVSCVRAWDLAATLPSEAYPDPDYTVGIKMAKLSDGSLIVLDMVRFRARHGDVITKMAEVARGDGRDCVISIPLDPGQAGRIAAEYLKSQLARYGPVVATKTDRSKLARFQPFAAAAEDGRVKILAAEWNDAFYTELEQFAGARSRNKDDIVDATADAFRCLFKATEVYTFKPDRVAVQPVKF